MSGNVVPIQPAPSAMRRLVAQRAAFEEGYGRRSAPLDPLDPIIDLEPGFWVSWHGAREIAAEMRLIAQELRLICSTAATVTIAVNADTALWDRSIEFALAGDFGDVDLYDELGHLLDGTRPHWAERDPEHLDTDGSVLRDVIHQLARIPECMAQRLLFDTRSALLEAPSASPATAFIALDIDRMLAGRFHEIGADHG